MIDRINEVYEELTNRYRSVHEPYFSTDYYNMAIEIVKTEKLEERLQRIEDIMDIT